MMNKRLLFIKIILSMCFVIVIFRLGLIMFVEHEAYFAKAKIQQIKKRRNYAKKRKHI